MLLLSALVAGTSMSWATTYKLTKVTSVSAGNQYVFEQNDHVLSNSISSSTLNTTDTYSKTGLAGTETYIWELESATGGFYLKNVSLQSNQYLNNTSSTSVSWGSKNSIWTIAFSGDVALISNKSNSNRFLGDTSTSGFNNKYKAYATSNLNDHEHDFTVYLVEEELSVTSLSIGSAPTKVRYEVGENLDMTGFSLDADGSSVTSGYTMTIGGSDISNGDALISAGKKTITVAYGGKEVSQAISVGAVTSIAVTAPPTTTTYNPGETFSSTGMEITASLSTGEPSEPDTWTKTVTGYTISPSTAFVGSETYVTITYAGQSVNQAITVNATHVTGVTLNKSSLSITCGNTDESLSATVAPAEATDNRVSWSSSNTSVATVNEDGHVTAVAVGTATITVTTLDLEKTATCEVTVTADSSKPSLVETIFEETFADVTGSTATSTSAFDNSGWTIGGDVYGNDGNGVRMAKSKGPGSITTPAITKMKSGATVSFKAQGWDEDEITISISGTNCTVSPTSFTDLSSTSFSEKSVTVTVTGENPKITFSAASGVRVKIDEIVITQSKTTADVKLSATGYASYCSPFALNLTPTEDYAAYAVTGTSGSTVTFTKIPGKVAANTPFILFNEDNAGETVSLPIVEDDDPAIAAVGSNMLRGTLSPTYITTVVGDYTNFGLSGGSFVKINAGTIKANKAYLPVLTANLPSDVKAFTFIFEDDDADGIETVDSRQQTTDNSPIYNLAGQRISKMQKGINIVNGKKILF